MTLTDVLLLAGGGLVAWKIYDAASDAQSEAQGKPVYWPLVVDAANAANVPPAILGGIVKAESSWSNASNSHSAACKVTCIASKVCAIGLAQVLPTTAADHGGSGAAQQLCDPATNLMISARVLRSLYSKYGDWHTAAVAYNWGPGNVDRAIKAGTSFYSGSLDYADKVVAAATDYNRGEALAGLSGLAVAARRPMLFRVAA